MRVCVCLSVYVSASNYHVAHKKYTIFSVGFTTAASESDSWSCKQRAALVGVDLS